ncbi:hypothetical protein QTI33_33950 [Variovorax sp. J22P271]|uniref:hypothetical protein n=1 Tax=Variovorax davisae TaxID=3053515 RepID=UPI0025773A54|nr:hypothetical protein [Variovorax sp. J22P271]MDM0037176.1 hypothetical protein [Variovorax sp. J22P271]
MRTSHLVAAIAMASCLCAHAQRTEYAFRWDPAQGGPATARQAARQLGIEDDQPKEFGVRYLEVRRPAGLPDDSYGAVARERTDDDGPESTYKVRAPASKAARKLLSTWACPLVGPKRERKLEVDVNWVGEEGTDAAPTPRKAISFSCSVEAAAAAAFPPATGMVPKPCVNHVRRFKSRDDWKVEEWLLATGQRIVELSFSVDQGSRAHRSAFQQRVDLLRAAGARPLADSKTLLGSSCPA